MKSALLLLLTIVLLTGCLTKSASLPQGADFGPHPRLTLPKKTLVPTMNIAKAIGWPEDGKPVATPGFAVNAFARDLDHPRWIYVLPNNDVLVAETNAPPKPDDNKGIKGWVKKHVMKRAGAVTPSANRISLLRDVDGDGTAETQTIFLQGLNSPFGIALVNNDFFGYRALKR